MQKFQKTKSLLPIMKNTRKVSSHLSPESWAQRNSGNVARPTRATGLQFLVTFLFYFGFQWDRREHILGNVELVCLQQSVTGEFHTFFFFFFKCGNASVVFNNCWWGPKVNVCCFGFFFWVWIKSSNWSAQLWFRHTPLTVTICCLIAHLV